MQTAQDDASVALGPIAFVPARWHALAVSVVHATWSDSMQMLLSSGHVNLTRL